ncbi:MAG: sigma-54 interaction domain-containing protein [Vicinamibacterales bacterium]
MASVLVIHEQAPLRASILDYVRRSGHQGTAVADLHQARARGACAECALVVVGVRDGERSETKIAEIQDEWPTAEIAVIRSSTDLVDVLDAIRHFEAAPATDAEGETRPGEPLSGRWNTPRDAGEPRARFPQEPDDVVVVDPLTRAMFARADRAAAVNSTVLITGESGTGKELLARRIHRNSGRRGFKFVPVNCGCLPESLVESELFGYKKGAFTGALCNTRGLIEEAERGVLFLDEIGDMPLSMQVRLLRFLDSGEIRAVGDTCVRHVDVRVIAATNQNLHDAIRDKRFREDLFFRLSVVPLELPPLRERRSDIPALVKHHTRRVAARLGLAAPKISDEALSLLVRHHWPGNVRELQNTIEQALVQASGDAITPEDLPRAIRRGAQATVADIGPDSGVTHEQLMTALRRTKGNHTEAAAELGISRTTLWRRLRQLKVTPGAERAAAPYALVSQATATSGTSLCSPRGVRTSPRGDVEPWPIGDSGSTSSPNVTDALSTRLRTRGSRSNE